MRLKKEGGWEQPFSGPLCHCCQICNARVSLFPRSIWECFLWWALSRPRKLCVLSWKCLHREAWGYKSGFCFFKILWSFNYRRCNDFTVSLCQARNQRQLGRPVMQTAINPGHRRAHENGECWWRTLTYHITLHASSLCTEMLCVCVCLCEATRRQRVRGEEDDPSSHPTDPRRAAARWVQLRLYGKY